MPAEFESGWFHREPAWHGLGKVTDTRPESMGQAREWADLTWEPERAPVFVRVPNPVPAIVPAEDRWLFEGEEVVRTMDVAVADWDAVVRSDTKQLLGMVRKSFGLDSITNLCDMVEATLGEVGPVAQLETMISLKGGAQVVIVAMLSEGFKVPGDGSQHYTYATFGTAFDGSAALTVFPTNIRAVCWNTWTAGKARAEEEFGSGIVIRHTKNIQERIEQAKKVLTGVKEAREDYLAIAEELGKIQFSREEKVLWVAEFIPEPPAGTFSDRVAKNISEAREAVLGILTSSPTCEGIRDSGFGALMAATEYLDHVRKSRSGETKFRRSLLRQEPLKNHALVTIKKVAAGTVG